MKTKLILALLLGVSSPRAQAFEDKIAYPSFQAQGSRYVFPDFQEAHYAITYDVTHQRVEYQAELVLDTRESGKILFDLVVNPIAATLDGQSVDTPLVAAPGRATTYRVFNLNATAGRHVVKIRGLITRLVKFEGDTVSSAFWLNDLYDRSYLENYLPSSFEYDRVKMIFDIQILGASVDHTVLTNGLVQKTGHNSVRVTYPDYYNTSSIFFHLLPSKRIQSETFFYKSIDGRSIPAMIYFPLAAGKSPTPGGNSMLKRYRSALVSKLTELERDFGHFLHSQILVYATTGGGFPGVAGMEYCGATMTDLDSLKHEITHSYFGRGIVPANGNAGWLDEAITTWGDSNAYQPSQSPVSNPTSLFTQGDYVRTTPRGAYSLGVNFVSEIAGKIHQKGDRAFVRFLADLLQNHAFQPYTNEDFWNWSADFYGYNLLSLIEPSSLEFETDVENQSVIPIHRKFNDDELLNLL